MAIVIISIKGFSHLECNKTIWEHDTSKSQMSGQSTECKHQAQDESSLEQTLLSPATSEKCNIEKDAISLILVVTKLLSYARESGQSTECKHQAQEESSLE